jgi:exodeoxyribonuclease V
VNNFTFSPDQQAAIEKATEWRARATRQHMTLGGLAGTGKTTLIAHLADEWPDTATLAVCGKAAHVLRSKGVDAQTVHSLLYVPMRCVGSRLKFVKRLDLGDVRTIICDEASMVNAELFRDLLSFGLPVLFVGDHGQLEPIGANPRLMIDPDIRLEKIHRQAQGNPIVRLALAFREGRGVPLWKDPNGRLSVLEREEFERLVRPDVQIVCGFNKTRHAINRRVRRMLGFAGLTVAKGEKLICLRNNKDWNIFNGQQLVVLEVLRQGDETIELEIQADDGRAFALPCLREQFGKDPVEGFWGHEIALMDYGYCLTAHKAQGSEWPEVLVLEELSRAWDERRWRYTVTTRAKERLTYCA